MRRGTTDLTPSPLAGEGGGEGKKGPLSPLWPTPRGVMPVLPVPTRSKILHFVQNDTGEDQNDHGEGMTTGEGDDSRGEMTIEGTVILSEAKNLRAPS